jgi:hypothetical protein
MASGCGGVETGRVGCEGSTEGDEVGEGVGEGGGGLEEGYFDRVVADVPCRYKILRSQRRDSLYTKKKFSIYGGKKRRGGNVGSL